MKFISSEIQFRKEILSKPAILKESYHRSDVFAPEEFYEVAVSPIKPRTDRPEFRGYKEHS